MVSSGTKVASSLRFGLSNSVRMKRECQASCVKTRVRTPNSGSAPARRSWAYKVLPCECAIKSWYKRANCAGVILPLFSHQTVSLVRSSQTIYLSFGLRPVCTPVSAQSAPPDVSWASPPVSARSYSSGSKKFQLTASRSVKPNLSAPYSGLRMPCSNIHFLLRRRSACACDIDDDWFAAVRRPTGAPQRPKLAGGHGKFRHITLARRAACLRQAGDEHVPVQQPWLIEYPGIQVSFGQVTSDQVRRRVEVGRDKHIQDGASAGAQSCCDRMTGCRIKSFLIAKSGSAHVNRNAVEAARLGGEILLEICDHAENFLRHS